MFVHHAVGASLRRREVSRRPSPSQAWALAAHAFSSQLSQNRVVAGLRLLPYDLHLPAVVGLAWPLADFFGLAL